jgi:hypothetical protein
MMKARHSLKKDGEGIKLVNMLEGTTLSEYRGNTSDVINFKGVLGLYKRTDGQRLPRNTLESLYEHILNDRLESLHPVTDQLNV